MTTPQETDYYRIIVDSAGRVVLPAEVRKHLGIKPGHEVILSEDRTGEGLRLQTFDQAVKAVQAIFAPYRIPGVSVVDELLHERKEEARKEYGE